MQHTKPLVSLICPVYNEAASVDALMQAIASLQTLIASDYDLELIVINDGSVDSSLSQLRSYQARYAWLSIIDLSRNFGKEAALSCGLHEAGGDCVIPIDADLQDPPELIPKMLKAWQNEGFEVVLAKREFRQTDTWSKRTSAGWFYRIHNYLASPTLPEDVGDFRLMDRRVVNALCEMPERQRFMKGLFAWVGFRQTTMLYERAARTQGESRFGLWKLWNLALEAITSFSTLPLRIWTYVGVVIALIAMAYGLFIITNVLLYGRDVPGYASLMIVILFLGGVQLIGLGVLGEYLGRTYMETKQRPIYVIRDRYSSHQDRVERQARHDL